MSETDARAEYIQKIQNAGLLDAAFLLFYYNAWVLRWGPSSDSPAELDVSEILPDLSQSAYEQAGIQAQRMWNGAGEVALAYYEYPGVKQTFEEALAAFEAAHPGFSSESYGLALNAAYVKLR
jgi:hypothetical protein